MSWLDEWKFCRKADCIDRVPMPGLGDAPFARLWLQRFQDLPKMRAVRVFLVREMGSGDLSRVSGAEVISRCSRLLAFGRVHIRDTRWHDSAFGEVPAQPASASEPLFIDLMFGRGRDFGTDNRLPWAPEILAERNTAAAAHLERR